MLIEFSVGNFRSFKEVVTFSMVVANLQSQDKNVDENNTFPVNEKLRLLKSAAIYGANASGKTNLVKAMQFVKAFVQNSSKDSQSDEPISTEAFLLDESGLDLPSFFEVVFRIAGTQYRYGFEANKESVISEWLFSVPRTKEANLFRRTQKAGIEIGEKYQEGRGLEKLTRNNALFLSVVAQFNGKIAEDILKWFGALRVVSEATSNRLLSSIRMLNNEQYADEMKEFIKELDLDIRDILIETREVDPFAYSGFSEATRRRLESAPKQTISEMKSVHRLFDEEGKMSGEVVFDVERQESDGTKKLIALASLLVPALKAGRILIVDELDARLHPLITSAVIRLFNSRDKNPQNAQLIFTTHDTNLLDKDLFRRDQIWFAEKDRQSATRLYSLAEFRVRNDNNSLETNYIHGRFGAIPFVGDFSRIFGAETRQNGTE